MILFLRRILITILACNCVLGEEEECRLYLAESSIPNAGMGMFSGINVEEGDIFGNPDISLPWFDVTDNDQSMLKRYIWLGYTMGIDNESDNVEVFNPGTLSLVNGHTFLDNVKISNTVIKDQQNLHRSKDAGFGAFSPYVNVQVEAMEPIIAGQELFADYGDDWYQYETRKKKFENAPSRLMFQALTRQFQEWEQFMSSFPNEISDKEFAHFWKFYKDILPLPEQAKQLLPSDLKGVKSAMKMGIDLYNAPKNFIRSMDYLEKTGICMDNLVVATSKIEQAGQGAFSKFSKEKGSIVMSSPVLFECQEDSFIYDAHGEKRLQLILNYGYSHNKSSITFYPYAPHVNLINHSSKEPNVRLQWSKNSRYQNNNWLKFSKEELCEQDHVELMWDYVAIRDVKKGDEILLDYGTEWERAWQKHLNTFKEKASMKEYKPASFFNLIETIKTLDEEEINPYPNNVYTECFCYIENNSKNVISWQPTDSYEYLYTCEVIRRKRNKNMILYDARIWLLDDEEHSMETLIQNIPRKAIRFNDAPYTSDIHSKQAFRHTIGIPDDIFPQPWMDMN